MQYMFFRWDHEIPIRKEWAWQPGDGMGKAPIMSISIEIPEKEYRSIVQRLRVASVKTLTKTPTWRQMSYWGWTVKDPMGNTIEVYAVPKEKPKKGQTPEWTW
jgi:hypothetical protein